MTPEPAVVPFAQALRVDLHVAVANVLDGRGVDNPGVEADFVDLIVTMLGAVLRDCADNLDEHGQRYCGSTLARLARDITGQ